MIIDVCMCFLLGSFFQFAQEYLLLIPKLLIVIVHAEILLKEATQ